MSLPFLHPYIGLSSGLNTRQAASATSGTRGVFGGGYGSTVMDYITIATTGNATNFGTLNYSPVNNGGLSDYVK